MLNRRFLGWCLLAPSVLISCSKEDWPQLEVSPPRGDFQPSEAFEGYTLFSPLRSKDTFLIDMQGEVVHKWSAEFKGTSVYLLEDGSILRSTQQNHPETFEAGGQGGRLQRIAWDGELLWDYVFATKDHLQHHDLEPMPNGNVLFIAWERKTREEAIAKGRDPELLEYESFWPDMLIEVRPIPPDSAEIVWEWHSWDHLVQNIDPQLPNYGNPASRPERIDINGDRIPDEEQLTQEEQDAEEERLNEIGYGGGEDDEEEAETAPEEETEEGADDEDSEEKELRRLRRQADWLHSNAVDYHPELDLVVISVLRFSEIWVIDHSTTTEEAGGSTGGRHDKGGDLLYRWGNPRTYGMGNTSNRLLFGQHDVQWIPAGYLGAGNFILYNNGADGPNRPWSSIEEFRLPMTPDGRIPYPSGQAFEPRKPVWRYEADPKEDFYSSFISGVQRLPNGNTLICEGESGRIFEVTPEGDTVWTWENNIGEEEPDPNDPPTRQFLNRTALFRATRVAVDHPGLSHLQE